MSELSPSARAFLDQHASARPALSAAKKAAIQKAVLASAAQVAGAAGTAAGGGSGVGGVSLAVKVTLALVVLGAGTTLMLWSRSAPTPAPTPQAETPAPQQVAPTVMNRRPSKLLSWHHHSRWRRRRPLRSRSAR